MNPESGPLPEQPRYLIPADWQRRPELMPALRILVEGARRAVRDAGSPDLQPGLPGDGGARPR